MASKKQLIAVLFLFTLGCNSDNDLSRNDLADGEIIRFKGHVANITSKAVIDDKTLPQGSEIGILSWGHAQNTSSNETIRKDLNNTLYIKSADDEFTSSVEGHFPINPDILLNFYSYYPYTASATANPLSIPFDLKKQDDIMWATPVLNRDKTTAETPVDLVFNHILSAITLKFKKADDIKENMELESISMENYPSTINLNVKTGALSPDASKTPYTIIDKQKQAITTTEATIVSNYLLYPIDKPVFIVRMSGKDYRIESTKPFVKGKKQTYSFTIQAKDIRISGSINPWEDGGESNETVYF